MIRAHRIAIYALTQLGFAARMSVHKPSIKCTFGLISLLGLLGCESTPSAEMALEQDRSTVRSVVRSHLGEVSGCYEKAIEERPGAEGRLLVQWDINSAGRVENQKVVEAGEKIKMVAPCVLKLMNSWQFPAPQGEGGTVSVRYPFIFSENGRTRFDD